MSSLLPARGFRRQTARASRLLLHWTAADGVLTPLSDQPLVFARTSAGTARDAAGRLRTVPRAAPRLHMVDADGDGVWEAPTLLLEPACTNAWTAAEDLSNGAWTLTGATVSANAWTAPSGTLAADKLAETAATSRHAVSQTLTGTTASTASCASAYVLAAQRTWLVVQTTDRAGTVAKTWVNLATGTLGTQAGAHTVWIEAAGAGWWRVAVSFSVNAGAGTPAVAWGCATANGTDSYLGVAGSGLLLWGLQAEIDRPYPTQYAPSARVVEQLSLTPGWALQDVTWYARLARPAHADATGTLDGSRYLALQNSGRPLLSFGFLAASRTLFAEMSNSVPTTVNATLTIPAGAMLEVCAQFVDLRTAPRCRIDVGGGFSAYSATLPAFTALAGALTIGDSTAGAGNSLAGGLSAFKVAAGAQTLAAMQSAF